MEDVVPKRKGVNGEACGGEACVGSSTGQSSKKRCVEDPLNQENFTADSTVRLRESFSSSQPYKHLVIRDLCSRDVLVAARDELIHNVEAKYKETDLFKVYQTGDLANMDGLSADLAERLPTLLRIRNAIYCERFRHFVEDVTDLPRGSLIDKTDCSSNCYAHGGHLICHDDVIGTRRVSYIIYLTDPDEEWQAEDGGALELYPLDDETPGEPTATPTTCLLPYFNSMAMFTVQPGRSFHSVQEVYTDSKPRLSISGWFHGTTPPEGADTASLSQLKSAAALGESVDLQHGLTQEDDKLTCEERAQLLQWMHPQYLERSNMRKMVAKWEETSCLQLQSFLLEPVARKVLEAIRQEDSRDALGNGSVPKYSAGVGQGWRVQGPCHKQRFMTYAPSTSGAVAGDEGGCGEGGTGPQLWACLQQLFKSQAFAKWLLQITDLIPQNMRAAVRRFRPGLDYTVAHGGTQADRPELDVTLCFVDDAEEIAAAAWASDELGAFQCYINADEEANEAAETYKSDAAEDSMISCSAAFNTLNILLRDSSLMKFVKYVSHDAPSSRYDVAIEFGTDLTEEELNFAED